MPRPDIDNRPGDPANPDPGRDKTPQQKLDVAIQSGVCNAYLDRDTHNAIGHLNNTGKSAGVPAVMECLRKAKLRIGLDGVTADACGWKCSIKPSFDQTGLKSFEVECKKPL